ncbi:MAG TPA: eL32 family ribosomal protein [Candidatus Nanoarchaeia archaeon]|nr:eL32 family ribosomal protein [Candidatus Nanoarchaeia archaeon]
MSNLKKLLEVKKQQHKKRPKFIRDGYGKRKRISKEWKRPRGRHLKLRHGFAGHRSKVKVGFRSPALVRGLTLEGLLPVIVHSVNEVVVLDSKIHTAIIGRTVGGRKKVVLLEMLKKHGVDVMNHDEKSATKILNAVKERKAIKDSRIARKGTKKQSSPAKEKKPELTPEEKEAKEKEEKKKVLTKGQ